MAKPIPDGYHSITPYIVVPDARNAIEFYKKAFGAVQNGEAHTDPSGRIMHAEIRIGNSIVMLSDENPEGGALSAVSLKGTPVILHLYVEDVDATFETAQAAGATVKMPVMDAFWGDRYGQLSDPFGLWWSVATHKEDLNQEQMMERAQAAAGEMAQAQ